jgi:hypothetical protein
MKSRMIALVVWMMMLLCFFLHGQAIVHLTSPNGGEVLLWDSTHTITWEFLPQLDNPFECDIYLSTDGGATFLDTIATGINDSLYRWTIPQITSSMCRVLIQVSSDIGCEDVSDSNFSIMAPGIEEDQEFEQEVSGSLFPYNPNPFITVIDTKLLGTTIYNQISCRLSIGVAMNSRIKETSPVFWQNLRDNP